MWSGLSPAQCKVVIKCSARVTWKLLSLAQFCLSLSVYICPLMLLKTVRGFPVIGLLHCISKKVNWCSKFLHCWKACEICYKPVQHYPPHLSHVATLPWEIKNSNFLQMWKKMQSNCILITSSFVIHSQILLFPLTDCKWNFPCHCSFSYLRLWLMCGTGNSSHHWDVTAVLVNNHHGIQRRGQDFVKKRLHFKGYTLHSKEVDRQISWEKLDKAWC